MLTRSLDRSRQYLTMGVAVLLTLVLLAGCSNDGSDSGSNILSVPAPAQVAATAGDRQVTITWSAVEGASSYNLYWSNTSPVTSSTGTRIENVTSSYVHDGLTNNETYYYVVTAVGPFGESEESIQVSAVPQVPPPSAPNNVSAIITPDAVKSVTLQWDPPTVSSGEPLNYNLYRSTSPDVASRLDDPTTVKTEGVVSPYIDTVPEGEVSYYYVLTAVDQTIEGSSSAEVSETPPALTAPQQIAATSGDTQVTVTWSEVVGATSYNLYWSNTSPVTITSGTKIADVTSPYAHTGLTNGETYYYVVTAVSPDEESGESPQVSAVPQVPPPTAPTNVTAILTPETVKSVTLQWGPPELSSGQPLSYNLYRSDSPDVALRLNDPTTVVTEGVVSPHIDTVPLGQVTYYYVLTAVDQTIEGDPSAEVSATPRGSPTGGGDTGYGNNLSVPLVFANGLGIGGAVITGSDYTDLATGLRPTATDVTDPFPYFNPDDIYLLGGLPYYEQQSSSTWQADWINGQTATQHVVADWGDNLGGAAQLSPNQVIRVEMVLYQDKAVSPSWPDTESMSGYNMALLYGQGILEMQGTDTTTNDATRRRVFAVNSRLMIEKLDDQGNPIPDHVCNFEGSVAEGLALPDGSQLPRFGSEINVGGALTYGFNWKINDCTGTKTGDWRLTFSLDDTAMVNGVSYSNNTIIDSVDGSNPTAVLVDPTTTTIDVTVN